MEEDGISDTTGRTIGRMAAPTLPLSAFTDGFATAEYAASFVVGFLSYFGPPLLATAIYLYASRRGHLRKVRARFTAWGLRREQRRSGRYYRAVSPAEQADLDRSRRRSGR